MPELTDLQRLLDIAHERTHHLPAKTPLRDLYQRAAHHAERCIDGALGIAIAGVLVMEAERLRVAHWDSPLGQSKVMLSLALATLDLNGEAAGA
jgi:hypothetical protein